MQNKTETQSLIYLDQSMLDPTLNINFNLDENTNLVYSKAHFEEINRSSNPSLYLEILEKHNAKLLNLELNANFEMTGIANLIIEGTPSQHYELYLEAISDVDVDISFIDSFQAWVNGGGEEGLLKDIPNNLAEQVRELCIGLPSDHQNDLLNKLHETAPEFTNTIDKIIIQGNDLKKTREAFGTGKGEIGGITGEKQIERIWSIIKPMCGELSSDQFFGFEHFPVSGSSRTQTIPYLGIISCCSILDILGFQAEKKCRKVDKIPNIRSDASHIAMGAFCSAIVSRDKRLINRAKAIYEYRNIKTFPILLTQ